MKTDWIESVTVLFEDGTADGDNDNRKALVELLRKVRGVAAVVPSSEVGNGHLEWREIVEALGVDPSEENAQEIACRDAKTAAAQLERGTRLVERFLDVATEEQQRKFAKLWLAPEWLDRQRALVDEQERKRQAALAKLTYEDRCVLGV